jgi:hypothetical protein
MGWATFWAIFSQTHLATLVMGQLIRKIFSTNKKGNTDVE